MPERDIESLWTMPPYGLDRTAKDRLFDARLGELTRLHNARCPAYARMLATIGFRPEEARPWRDLPFLPVSLFKEYDLVSVPGEEVFKVLTSSDTTGQAVSRIHLDRATAALQQKALARIVTEAIGAPRLPMLVVDCPSVLRDRKMFSARGAGILGFSLFGADRTHALNDDMRLDFPAVEAFLERHAGQPVLLFGFTFIVWQHFYEALRQSGRRLNLERGILLHGGGWKKLASQAVSPDEFRQRLADVCGLKTVRGYYGMAEQTGSICMECEAGRLHTSIFSDVVVRDALRFRLCEPGQAGILQTVSLLPRSYPGHSLLTEDEGVLLGIDDCPCGRKGASFQVNGRLKNAEIRGCSDTYAAG